MNFSIFSNELYLAFWLSFSRWVSILFQLPLFDNIAVPNLLKILLSFIMAYVFFPVTQGIVLAEISMVGTDNIWILVGFHTFVGLMIGFMVKIIMTMFISTGSILTQQIGFASVSYFDPTQAQQVGPFERMLEWTILILLLSSGALVPMLQGALSSFETINISQMEKITKLPEYFIYFFKSSFKSSVLLATPIIFANLLMNLVFGIVARTVPQMNILMVSFVVNIGIGLLLFLGIVEEFFKVGFDIYIQHLGDWFEFIRNK